MTTSNSIQQIEAEAVPPHTMRSHVEAYDWSTTPLGPKAGWPQSFKTAVELCLDSALATFVFLGPELTQIYNDASIGILRGKHPAGLGQPASECWSDVWPVVAELIDHVMDTGEAVVRDDLPVTTTREGFPDEVYCTFCYSAVRDEAGKAAGVLVTAIETTLRVRAEAARRKGDDLLSGQKQRLEMHAAGAGLHEVLAALAHLIESSSEGTLASILVREPGAAQFSLGIGPSLPPTYVETLSHAPITPPYVGPCGRAAWLGEEILTADIATDERWSGEWRTLVGGIGLKSCYSTPIHGPDGTVLGSFGFYRKGDGDPRPRDRSLLGIATGIAGIAIDHFRATQAVRESEERQAFLLRLSDALRPLTTAAAIQQAAARLLGAYFAANHAFFADIHEDDGISFIGAGYTSGGRPGFEGEHVVSRFLSLSDRMRDGAPLVIADVVESPLLTGEMRDDYANANIAAFVSIPLIRNGKLESTLNVTSPTRRQWSANDLDVLEEAAERTWDFIERARAQMELSDNLAAAEQLQQFSVELIHEDDTAALYGRLLDAAMALMHSDMASMQMLDPRRGELQLLASSGFHPVSAKFWEWVRADSSSTCGAALASGHRIIVEDVETSDFMAGTEDLEMYRRSEIRAVQSTPLVSRSGRPLGMISTHWRKPHLPTEREIGRLDVLARQAADLIERKDAEDVLREASHMKDELLGLISHEFRNPLATIIGNIGLLHRRVALDPEARDALIEDLQRDSSRLKSLIENMLVLSRADASDSLLEPVLLQRLLPPIIAMARFTSSREFKLVLPSDLPPALASPAYFEQVIENLISNARKYGADGTPIEVEADALDGAVRITVRDRGAIYSEGQVAQFFEPFFRSPANHNRVAGLGLGMSVCRRLVEIQGGELTACPRNGGGIEVRFTLQVVPDDDR